MLGRCPGLRCVNRTGVPGLQTFTNAKLSASRVWIYLAMGLRFLAYKMRLIQAPTKEGSCEY